MTRESHFFYHAGASTSSPPQLQCLPTLARWHIRQSTLLVRTVKRDTVENGTQTTWKREDAVFSIQHLTAVRYLYVGWYSSQHRLRDGYEQFWAEDLAGWCAQAARLTLKNRSTSSVRSCFLGSQALALWLSNFEISWRWF